MIRASRLALAAGALLAMACSDSQSPPAPTTIVLSASTVTFDAIGASRTITATVNDQRGNPMPSTTVTWTSSSAAATVVPTTASSSATSPSAVITSALNGPSTITATAGGASASVDVITAQVAATLQKVSGDAQAGTVNLPLSQAISVRVIDRLGAAIAGQVVTFAVTQGGGVIAQASVTSGADGIASNTWTLGKLTSQTHQTTATLGSLVPAVFTATATAGAPAKVAIVAGDKQTGPVGVSVAQAPQVVVTDGFDNVVPNVNVTFTPSDGVVAFPNTVTNNFGIATSGTWTLGTTPGVKTLAASAVGAPTVTLSATAVVGPPANLTLIGNNQTANAGTVVPVRPGVRIVDAFSNPIMGMNVTFSIGSGGGAITGASQTTDATGTATIGSWTLGANNGANTIIATPATTALSARTITALAINGAGGASTGGTIAVSAGGNQAAMAGQAVPITPTVTVRDVFGTAVPGVTVTFTVTSGGGSVTGATATTNASGVASVGSWTVGGAAALNTLTADAVGYSGVAFKAAGCEGGGAGYSITVCYRTDMTASQRQAFVDAAAKWRSIITSDLPDVTGSINENDCSTGTPSLTNITVDDLLIFAAIEPIDGVNNILGSAGWCYTRNPGLPVIGTMQFDIADVPGLEASNRFGAVILHEMGHVIGIGSSWQLKGLLQNKSSSTSKLDTYFSGVNAIAAFNAIGGATYTGGQKVPVENTSGIGTINVHWRESVLANELMTGFLNTGSNPLSLVTVRSLEDLGYTVNAAAADPFSLFLSINANVLGIEDTGALWLGNDTFTGKKWSIDKAGRKTRIP